MIYNVTAKRCTKKLAARLATIVTPYHYRVGQCTGQYWTMCAANDYEGCELNQMLAAGFIEAHQFHGVDLDAEVIERNREAHPHVAWYHGDLLLAMQAARAEGRFNPSVVNADFTRSAKREAEYVARLLAFLNCERRVMLVANLALSSRNRQLTSVDQVFQSLDKFPQARFALPQWEVHPRYYEYPGTGPRSTTRMGTFLFFKE